MTPIRGVDVAVLSLLILTSLWERIWETRWLAWWKRLPHTTSGMSKVCGFEWRLPGESRDLGGTRVLFRCPENGEVKQGDESLWTQALLWCWRKNWLKEAAENQSLRQAAEAHAFSPSTCKAEEAGWWLWIPGQPDYTLWPCLKNKQTETESVFWVSERALRWGEMLDLHSGCC